MLVEGGESGGEVTKQERVHEGVEGVDRMNISLVKVMFTNIHAVIDRVPHLKHFLNITQEHRPAEYRLVVQLSVVRKITILGLPRLERSKVRFTYLRIRLKRMLLSQRNRARCTICALGHLVHSIRTYEMFDVAGDFVVENPLVS